MSLTILQAVPALNAGGVERGTLEVARELTRLGHRSIVVSAGGRLVPALEAAGSEHVSLSIGEKSPRVLRHVRPFRALLHDRGVDIIHARSRLPAWIAWLARRGMAGGPRPHLVTTVHGPYTVNAYSAIMTRGDRVIAISDFIRRYLETAYAGLDRDRVRVVPRGVDPAAFPRGYRPGEAWLRDFEAQYPAIRGRALLTLPARITRWKGAEDFLGILKRLVDAGRPVHGLLVGEIDPRRTRFLRQLELDARRKGIHAHLTFTGHRDDIREILSISRVVLSLARTPEAFGRTALEALCLGVPVVAYDHGGASEILRVMFPQGRVPPGDVDAAAARIAEFCDAPPPVTAPNPFTLQRMLDATLDIYRELGHAAG